MDQYFDSFGNDENVYGKQKQKNNKKTEKERERERTDRKKKKILLKTQ